jgi:hypothetical protein
MCFNLPLLMLVLANWFQQRNVSQMPEAVVRDLRFTQVQPFQVRKVGRARQGVIRYVEGHCSGKVALARRLLKRSNQSASPRWIQCDSWGTESCTICSCLTQRYSSV